MSSMPVIDIRDLRFAWDDGPALLDIAEYSVLPGERVFLRGPSGSGKSTLLGLIAGVLEPQAGKVEVLGHDMTQLSGPKRDALRADRLGVIFQMFNLVPYLSLVQNVTLPCRFSSARRKAAGGGDGMTREAERLLSRLGLSDPKMLERPVTELSVGQQQRVAVARALIGGPDIVIADEPTSALDAEARDRFIELLNEEAARSGSALLFVSHDGSLAGHFDRSVDLKEINRAKGGV
ncbi:MAG: methionine ABC transporter ATP-binding protein [Henriciella sp.]|nr:methionine ABC transporter ATP-binding protein [Henriciella sp.]MBF33907.1 methionine ABC transporter ATP-binding protein [Hyphomonadaceae bacterium]MBK76546.1 methionine ABC transporter ATP-binding protein [Henriciella sp.]PHR79785.1 MAG: methionine ABC transporter ATP-binding protein [Henriciella sp.]